MCSVRYTKGSVDQRIGYVLLIRTIYHFKRLENHVTKFYKSNKDYCLTAAKNRGGLWLANPTIVGMFLAAEAVFRIKTEGIKPKIDKHDTVKCLLKESSVHAAISHLRINATLATSKEITEKSC